MNFKSVKTDLTEKSGFISDRMDGICHIKTLPYLSIAQSVKGSYDIKLGNGETYSTGEGGFFIAPSDIQQTITHRADTDIKAISCRWVFLKIELDDMYDFDSLFDFPLILPDEYKEEMNGIFNRLFESDNVFDENICCYEIAKILYLIAKSKENKFPSFIENTISFIKKHYREKLSVPELAGKVNLSPSYFFSVFKKSMGVSPIAFLNNYRLSLAVELLINSNKAINEIAYSVGIDDPVYFNKMFRKAYQISPGKYREIYKTAR